MRHLLSLTDWTRDDLDALFAAAEAVDAGDVPQHQGVAALFFPAASLRTRVSFEAGADGMGLLPITLPPETLDKDETLADFARYLANWADVAIVRHRDPSIVGALAAADALPVINALTDQDHPCEVLSDLYGLSRDADVYSLRFLMVGADGNIARAWRNAGAAFGLSVTQCSPEALRAPDMDWTDDLATAITEADVIITDAPGPHANALARYRITAALLDTAPEGVRLNPCPPFIRGREVSSDAIEHRAFVGHGFKRVLKPVQQAVMAWVLGDE